MSESQARPSHVPLRAKLWVAKDLLHKPRAVDRRVGVHGSVTEEYRAFVRSEESQHVIPFRPTKFGRGPQHTG